MNISTLAYIRAHRYHFIHNTLICTINDDLSCMHRPSNERN